MKIINGLLLFGLTATCALNAGKHHRYTPEQNRTLKDIATRYDHKNWRNIAIEFNKICGTNVSAKSCMKRFLHHLSDNIDTSWSKEDDVKLLRLVEELGTSWVRLLVHFPGKTNIFLKNKYSTALSAGKRRRYTPEQDCTLKDIATRYNHKNWPNIAIEFNKICGTNVSAESCRERFRYYLSDNIDTSWSNEDDVKLLRLVEEFGTSWVRLLVHFPGKTDMFLKNKHMNALRRLNANTAELNRSTEEEMPYSSACEFTTWYGNGDDEQAI